jgi:hypothetical protein
MTPKLQEKPSALKSEHQALQKMKILSFFLFFCVIFPLLDGSAICMPIRIRIQQLKLMRSHADPDPYPDPKPCSAPYYSQMADFKENYILLWF